MQHAQHTFQFCSTSCQMTQTTTFASNDSEGATCILSPHDFFSLLDHKKLHAKRPIWSTIWSTKKFHAKTPFWSTIWSTKGCTRKDPSGARFGAQKVAREKTYLEHDLEHEKLHAKRPIWSTIWSTKSCKTMAVLQFVNCQLCRMAAMSKMARHCEEDIANKSQSTRTAYSKINHFWGDVFAGGPTNKTLLLTVTDIRLESTYITHQ